MERDTALKASYRVAAQSGINKNKLSWTQKVQVLNKSYHISFSAVHFPMETQEIRLPENDAEGTAKAARVCFCVFSFTYEIDRSINSETYL